MTVHWNTGSSARACHRAALGADPLADDDNSCHCLQIGRNFITTKRLSRLPLRLRIGYACSTFPSAFLAEAI